MDPKRSTTATVHPRPFVRAAGALVGLAALLAGASACSSGGEPETSAPRAPTAPTAAATPAPPAPEPAAAVPSTPDELPFGLVIGLAPFEDDENGKPKPGAALLEILTRKGGSWHSTTLRDEESNVFHKAMAYTPPGGEPGLLTVGGTKARVKLWHHGDDGWSSETLWAAEFGEARNFKRSRMRDVEVGAILSEEPVDIAVVTHDEGVVAVLQPDGAGAFTVHELDRQDDTIVHEVELGDLDGDGVTEVYATPSEPNRLDGTEQPGHVVRYVPAAGKGREEVAALGSRHAKEILVADIDGDGTDELYVSVEGKKEGRKGPVLEPVEIRRYDAGTDPSAGRVIATLDGEWLTRFLTPGDVDGDGALEIVAATYSKGLWLLRPGDTPEAEWSATLIDADSRGFEHAALLTDLDGDGTDELYVSSDPHGEVRRYVWNGNDFDREVIHTRPPNSAFSWNIMAVPVHVLE